LLQHLSTKENERNLCQDLLTVENTDSDLIWKYTSCTMQMSYLVRVILSFQKLLQTRQTNRAIRNYQKQGLVMIKRSLGNSQINSIPE